MIRTVRVITAATLAGLAISAAVASSPAAAASSCNTLGTAVAGTSLVPAMCSVSLKCTAPLCTFREQVRLGAYIVGTRSASATGRFGSLPLHAISCSVTGHNAYVICTAAAQRRYSSGAVDRGVCYMPSRFGLPYVSVGINGGVSCSITRVA
jgi:hypothetical protein